MDKQLIIQKTADHVKSILQGEGSGHDWWHIQRVWNNAKHLAKMEQVDLFIVELGALLHDIADWKFHDFDAGPKAARAWLEPLGVGEDIIQHVCEIIAKVSYKGAHLKDDMPTIEGRIVQDADRLDAIGAIGIARCFSYGGNRNREMYNPDVAPDLDKYIEHSRVGNDTTINHFHEKLLLLKSRMKTESGKQIAQQRHEFMESFLKQFHAEWEGKA